jgi:hypothetical protein
VTDPQVIREASRRAIAEAQARAECATDTEVEADERATARYLRQVLPVIVSGLAAVDT